MAGRSHPEVVALPLDEEITIERRVRIPEASLRAAVAVHATTRMEKVDARLLAIARGDLDPEEVPPLLILDDPFGGLIPVYEPAETAENLDGWLLFNGSEPEPLAVLDLRIPYGAVPRLHMRAAELVALPLDHRSGFLLSHIDGQRSVEEIVDVSHLGPDDTLEVLAALVALRAIAID